MKIAIPPRPPGRLRLYAALWLALLIMCFSASYALGGSRGRISGGASGVSPAGTNTFTGSNTFTQTIIAQNAVALQMVAGNYLSFDVGNAITIRNASGSLELGGMVISASDNNSDLGNSTHRFRNVYAGTGLYVGAGNLALSGTAPTITSAGTSPSVTTSNGATTFRINVGTGGTATTIVLAMPAATTNWNCSGSNLTAAAANRNPTGVLLMQSSTSTAATLQYQTVGTGVALAFVASDIVQINCIGE